MIVEILEKDRHLFVEVDKVDFLEGAQVSAYKNKETVFTKTSGLFVLYSASGVKLKTIDLVT